jgi:hypothetical protein
MKNKMNLLHKSISAYILIFQLVGCSGGSAGVDVEGRIIESANTDSTYYSILAPASLSAPSKTTNPIKNVTVYAEPKDWQMPWASAVIDTKVDCTLHTVNIIRFNYFKEKNGRGEKLPSSISRTHPDLINLELPENIKEKVFYEGCLRI